MSSIGEDIKSIFKNHLFFVIIMGILYVLGAYTVIFKPELDGITELEAKFFVFGASMQATILLIAIGIFLIYRYFVGGRENTPNLIWGISFLLYSILFIGFMFSAWTPTLEWADMSDPIFFFLWRQTMIWWVVGCWIAIAMILIPQKTLWHYLPAMAVLVFSYLWFAFGLLIEEDIEMTMYGFLFAIFIPMCAILAYTFHLFSKATGLKSPRYLTIGFIGLGITYVMWAPWHATSVPTYFLWFFLFVVTLVPILIGFLLLPYEQEAKT